MDEQSALAVLGAVGAMQRISAYRNAHVGYILVRASQGDVDRCQLTATPCYCPQAWPAMPSNVTGLLFELIKLQLRLHLSFMQTSCSTNTSAGICCLPAHRLGVGAHSYFAVLYFIFAGSST